MREQVLAGPSCVMRQTLSRVAFGYASFGASTGAAPFSMPYFVSGFLRTAYPMVTPISFPLHFVGISFGMCIHSPDDVFISKCVN